MTNQIQKSLTKSLTLSSVIIGLSSITAIVSYFLPFQSHNWSLWKMAWGYAVGGTVISGADVFVVQTAPNLVGFVVILGLALDRVHRIPLVFSGFYFVIWFSFLNLYALRVFRLQALSYELLWTLTAWLLGSIVAAGTGFIFYKGWKNKSQEGMLLFLAFLYLNSCTLEIMFSILEDKLLLNYGAILSASSASMMVVGLMWRGSLKKILNISKG